MVSLALVQPEPGEHVGDDEAEACRSVSRSYSNAEPSREPPIQMSVRREAVSGASRSAEATLVSGPPQAR